MHCVESVQIRSYFWSVFSRIRGEYGEIRSIWSVFSRIRGEYGPEITPNLDNFHAVMVLPQKILAKEWELYALNSFLAGAFFLFRCPDDGLPSL